VGLKRGSLSLVNKIQELLGRNSNGVGLESENTAALTAKVGTNLAGNRRSLGRTVRPSFLSSQLPSICTPFYCRQPSVVPYKTTGKLTYFKIFEFVRF
jgi:hypothetical protein